MLYRKIKNNTAYSYKASSNRELGRETLSNWRPQAIFLHLRFEIAQIVQNSLKCHEETLVFQKAQNQDET